MAKPLSYYRDLLNAATAAGEVARAARDAALVPESDIDTSCHNEPITVSGWYEQYTISGRAAWRFCNWHNGILHEEPPTYSRQADEAYGEACLAHYEATRDYEMNHPAPVARRRNPAKRV